MRYVTGYKTKATEELWHYHAEWPYGVWLVVVSRKHISFWECEYIRIHLNSLNLFIKQAGSMALSCVTGWVFVVYRNHFCNLHFSLPNDISFYALKTLTSVLHLQLVMYYIDWQKIRFLRFWHSLIFCLICYTIYLIIVMRI